jgi:hypothetical protein
LAGLRVASVPTLQDVDTAADAVSVSRAVPGTRFAAAVRAVPALRQGSGVLRSGFDQALAGADGCLVRRDVRDMREDTD